MRSLILTTLVAVSFIIQVAAQAVPPGMTKENDWYPLGGIEAEGLVDVSDKTEGILIKAVFPDGLAAKAGLLPGDLIFMAEGKKLKGKNDDEVIDRFIELIESAESQKPKAKPAPKDADPTATAEATLDLVPLDLVILRDGSKEKITVQVRAYPDFHKSDVTKCKKSAEILKEALEFLAQDQKEDGRPGLVANENHAVATASLSGLAWLGSGDQKYAVNIERAAEFVMEQAGKERDFGGMRSASASDANWNQTNWALGYGSIFLAEYVARSEKQNVLLRLTEMVKKLEENQEKSGGWAHGPGGPNALNYLELEIMSNFALGGMGMAERVGVELDRAKVIKAYEWIKSCTSGGGVAYSPLPGQMGNGDPGRTAGAYWALLQAGRSGDLASSMSKFYQRDLDELYEGHACPTMHLLNGALASALGGKGDFAKYWKHFRPFLMSLRLENGSFGFRPTAESRQMGHHADRSWGPAFSTAHVAIILQLAQGRFKLLDVTRGSN